MRKTLLPLTLLAIVGCSSEPAPKADTGAPATQYTMVPATTGGTGSTTPAPATTPAAPAGPVNPPSAGSD